MKNKLRSVFIPMFLCVCAQCFFAQAALRAAPPVISGAVKPVSSQSFRADFAARLDSVLRSEGVKAALLLFESLPPDQSEDPSLEYLHASLLLSAGEAKKADVIARKLLAQSPAETDILFLNAYIAKALGDANRKNAMMKEVLKINPSDPVVYAEMGSEQMTRRNWQQAKTYFQKSLASDPLNGEALLGFGQTSYYTGNMDDAKKSFETLVKTYPDESMGFSFLGKLEAEKGRYAEAEKYVKKALEIDDSYYNYWIDYGDYLRFQGKFAAALTAFDRAAALNPEYFLTYVYRANVYELLDEYGKAFEDYKLVIKYNPQYYYAYESMGMYAWKEGRWDESRAAFEKAYEKNANNVSYALMISACYQKEGKKADNQAFLTKAMRNMDRSGAEYAVLRLYLDRIGDNAVLQKVQNLESRNLRGKLLYYMGLFYEIGGLTQTSIALYTEVLNMKTPLFFEYRLCEWAMAVLKPAP